VRRIEENLSTTAAFPEPAQQIFQSRNFADSIFDLYFLVDPPDSSVSEHINAPVLKCIPKIKVMRGLFSRRLGLGMILGRGSGLGFNFHPLPFLRQVYNLRLCL
jgi:hypothetical protein